MDNEEPTSTEAANVQLASQGHKLPEQSRIPSCPIPRPFSFEHLIHQWQPMGFRVVLNLPFVSNDQDYIFAIRNGPFIPTLFKQYGDSSARTGEDNVGRPDYTKRMTTTLDTYMSYAHNNTKPVIHGLAKYQSVKPDEEGKINEAIYITQYDQPPALATFATMFRKWRGTMHYRIRVVSGFTTQGYIFCSLIRNSPANIGIFDTASLTSGIFREDDSYREAMMNSYIMGDSAMFRHFEVEVPFEYPVPYYDQYNWIGNRTRPANNFMYTQKPDGVWTGRPLRSVRNEPHGDNYLVFGVRGRLESGLDKSQIAFELEYRAGEDFQFADPFLPYNANYLVPYQKAIQQMPIKTIQVPSDIYKTDGLHIFQKKSDNPLPIPNNNQQPTVRPRDPHDHTQPVIENNRIRTSRSRNPRSVDDEDEGVDEIDQHLVENRNFRKVMQTLSNFNLGDSSRDR